MRADRTLLCLIAVWAGIAFGGERQLEFSGFTAYTTIDAAKARYPHSRTTGSAIFVVAEDSSDHIYQVAFLPGAVYLMFEKQQTTGPPLFPLCQPIVDRIHGAFGGPKFVQNSHEEAMMTQRSVWARGTERLALRCFSRGADFYAERVELYKEPADAV